MAVPQEEALPLAVTVRRGDGVDEVQGLKEGLPVELLLVQADVDALWLLLPEAVAEALGEVQGEGEAECDCEGVPLAQMVLEGLRVVEGEGEALGHWEELSVPLTVPEVQTLGEAEEVGEGEEVTLGEGETEGEWDALPVLEALALPVPAAALPLPLGDKVGLPLLHWVALPL